VKAELQAKVELETELQVQAENKAAVHLKHPQQNQKQGIIDTPKMHEHVNISVNNIVIANIRKQQIQNLIVKQNPKAKRT
jgi:hypothetical protein